eukprot:9123579-Heterocapsa_arctica.AAC.1
MSCTTSAWHSHVTCPTTAGEAQQQRQPAEESPLPLRRVRLPGAQREVPEPRRKIAFLRSNTVEGLSPTIGAPKRRDCRRTTSHDG